MKAAPIPNMTKGIVSLWFRDARKNKAPSPQEWPSGVWTPDTSSMVPPDVSKVVTQEQFNRNVFYWNSYGRNVSALGVALPIFQGPAVMMPSPPPFVANGMHMMLTFGNANQSYNYCPWMVKLPDPDVIEAVIYVPPIVTGPQWSVPNTPPPYAPYLPFGKFKPATFVLDESKPRPDFVPQSFIGVDKDGYLTICLQTNTKAKYKGYAFQLDKITEIWATATYYDSPIPITARSGHWVKVPGYWDGYEFGYKDISDDVMGAQSETFVIGGPPGSFDFVTIPTIRDGAWHHLLFSFDIAGSVEMSISAGPPGSPVVPVATTQCKAWLALDDKNYTGAALQHRFPIHDGLQLPLLPGMGTDILGFGPVTTATRGIMHLGDNDILPRNCWIMPFRGIPKDGLQWFASTAGLWNEESTALIEKGDYNWFVWTGNIWPLFAVLGDTNWRGELKPPRPSTPDPRTFDVPTYQCDGFSIPVADHPIGVPVSAYHLEHNTGIEMAELQIWANVTLDTSEVELRRLFIQPKIDPVTNRTKYIPVPPAKAAEMLGEPDVLLHGSSNWKRGKNSGKSGKDHDGRPTEAGAFEPVAGIEKFKPEPELGK